MSRKFLTHVDLGKNELQNAVIQQLGSAPGSPVQGQIYYNTGDDNLYIYDGAGWVDLTVQGGGGSGDVVGPSSSVDNEIALFNSTTGKLIKRASLTGLVKATSGVASAAVSGTDYAPATSGSAILKGNGSGGFSSATAGTDYYNPGGTDVAVADGGTGASTLTGVLKGNGTSAVTGSATLTDVGAPTASFSFGSQKITSLADGTATTDGVNLGQVQNLVNGVSWKTAVRVATTANGTLATAYENGDAVDGVTLATGDRILLKNQSSGAENGIYTVNASGAPTRATDADTAAEIRQATVLVQEGTANADTTWTLTNDGAITLGTTSLTFALQGTGSVAAASTTVAGKVELADSTEAEAKSSSTLALTPASVVNFTIKKSFNVGDGSSTSIALTHNLGSRDVITQVYDASTYAVVECDIVNTSTTQTTLTFTIAPSSNAYRAVIQG